MPPFKLAVNWRRPTVVPNELRSSKDCPRTSSCRSGSTRLSPTSGCALPWLADHIPSIQDARERHLRPGGVLIPGQDTVCAAIVDAPKHFARRAASWDKNEYGLNLDAVRKRTINTWGKHKLPGPQLLTQSQCWATLDYYTIEDFDCGRRVALDDRKRRHRPRHQQLVRDKIDERSRLFQRPRSPAQPHVQPVFLSLAAARRPCRRGSRDGPAAGQANQRQHIRMDWNTEVCTDEGQPKAQFNQSTFAGKVWSPEDSKRRLPTFVPKLNGAAEIDAEILQLMDGQRNQQAIGQEIAPFPRAVSHGGGRTGTDHCGDQAIRLAEPDSTPRASCSNMWSTISRFSAVFRRVRGHII